VVLLSVYSQDITSYRITTILENLSDGNHTIEAYANDMSTARTFTVDSHYVVPTISVLSPTNQTYNGKVPLMFAVNTNFTEASYLIWPKTMDTHYEGQLSGNSSVSNLPNGNYFMDLWAITEKGEYVEATANFTINTGSQLPLELDPFVVYIMMGIVIAIVAVGSVSLICYKRRKGEP
jgi:hypothetical protein